MEDLSMSRIITTILWHDKLEVPFDFKQPIIYVSENNKVGTFKDTMSFYGGDINTAHSGYDRLRDKYKIKWWSYQNELIKLLETKTMDK